MRLLSVFFLLLLNTALQAQTSNPAILTEAYAWRNVRIVAGGFITGILFSPLEKDLAYCRTDIGGAYRFDHDSNEWVPLTDWVGPHESNFTGCESIALDPTDANTVYLALGTYSGGPAAIARSTDRGKTFQVHKVPFSMGANENGRGMGERLLVDPVTPRTLYFASRRQGLWMSADYGATWVKRPLRSGLDPTLVPSPDLSFVLADPRTATLYLAVADPAAPSHLLFSIDHGTTFEPLPALPAPHNAYIPHRAAILRNSLYVTVNNGPGPNDVTAGAVYRLDIREGRWTDITPPPPRAGGRVNAGFAAVALDPQHPGTLLVSTLDRWSAGDEIYRSTDSGKSWKALSPTASRDPALSPYLYWGQQQPRFGWWIAALALDPFDSDHALYGTGATIWGTHNLTDLDGNAPTAWSVAANGIEETAVLALISPPSGAPLISGLGDIGGFTHDDLGKSPPSGMHENPRFTNTNLIDVAWRKPSMVVRSGTPGGAGAARPTGPTAAVSADGGHSWRTISLPAEVSTHVGAGGSFFGATPVLIFSSDGATLLTSTQTGFAFTRDLGNTWLPVKGLPPGLHPIADRAADETFYALDLSGQKRYISTDGGVSFSASATSGLSAPSRGRSAGLLRGALQSSPVRGGELFLLLENRLYHSIDAGSSWHPLTDASISVHSFSLGAPAPGNKDPTLFIAGTLRTVPALYRSTDLALNWVRINDEAHQYGAFPTVLTADPRIFGRLYIGTNGRGILYGEPAK